MLDGETASAMASSNGWLTVLNGGSGGGDGSGNPSSNRPPSSVVMWPFRFVITHYFTPPLLPLLLLKASVLLISPYYSRALSFSGQGGEEEARMLPSLPHLHHHD